MVSRPLLQRHAKLYKLFVKECYPVRILYFHDGVRKSNNQKKSFLQGQNSGESKFTSSTVAFYQKSIFNLLNPFTNTLS